MNRSPCGLPMEAYSVSASPGAVTALIVGITFAGCLTGFSNAPQDHRTEALNRVNFTSLDLDPNAPSARFVLAFDGHANVTLNHSIRFHKNQGEERAWDDCGRVRWTHVRAGEELASSRSILLGDTWAESGGHTLVLGMGGRPTVVSSGSGQDDWFGPMSIKGSVQQKVVPGDTVVVDIASKEGRDSRADGYVEVSADAPVIRQVDQSHHRFFCGASFGRFSGDFLFSGRLKLGAVAHAAVTVQTDHGTDDAFLVVRRYSSTPGYCRASLHLDGEEVNRTSSPLGWCAVHHSGDPGEVTFRIDRAAAVSPQPVFFVWDRRPR